MIVTLLDLKKDLPKQPLIIQDFTGPEVLVQRLLEIGLRKGSEIKILGKAPLNGPLLIQMNSAVFALRDEESQCLLIQSRK